MGWLSRNLWLLWPLGAVPFLWLLFLGVTGAMGPDPAKEFVASLGWWALVGLIAALSIRPATRILAVPWLLAARRTFGLLAFAYVCLHLLAWAWLLLGFDWSYIGAELNKRPYILVGFTAWLLLLPLALTSTRGSRRRLGRRWQLLHRLIYPAVLLGLLHDIWIQKSGYGEQLVFGLLLGLLFLWRIMQRQNRGKMQKK